MLGTMLSWLRSADWARGLVAVVALGAAMATVHLADRSSRLAAGLHEQSAVLATLRVAAPAGQQGQRVQELHEAVSALRAELTIEQLGRAEVGKLLEAAHREVGNLRAGLTAAEARVRELAARPLPAAAPRRRASTAGGGRAAE